MPKISWYLRMRPKNVLKNEMVYTWRPFFVLKIVTVMYFVASTSAREKLYLEKN